MEYEDKIKLFNENKKLVLKLATSKFFHMGVNDIIQEGYLSFWEQLDKYDPCKSRISTFVFSHVYNTMKTKDNMWKYSQSARNKNVDLAKKIAMETKELPMGKRYEICKKKLGKSISLERFVSICNKPMKNIDDPLKKEDIKAIHALECEEYKGFLKNIEDKAIVESILKIVDTEISNKKNNKKWLVYRAWIESMLAEKKNKKDILNNFNISNQRFYKIVSDCNKKIKEGFSKND